MSQEAPNVAAAALAAGKLLPQPSDPQWYFAFLVVALVLGALGIKWLEIQRAKRARRGAASASDTYETLSATSCPEHARRIKNLEDEIGKLYDAFNQRQLDSERTIQESVRKQFNDFRAEQDRRDRELREGLQTQLSASEQRMMSAMERLVASIGQMFRQSQDGVGVQRPVPPPT